MNHLPLDIICRIADGDITQREMESYLTHWKTCNYCKKEIEFQQSILKVSRKAQLVNPSDSFTENVLDVIIPSHKKRWFEWILHNMGNVIAMVSVLAFLVYIFSITESPALQNDKPAKDTPVMELIKIIHIGSQQISSYSISKFLNQNFGTFHPNTIVYALLAIILLVLIDRIANHFFHQLRPNL